MRKALRRLFLLSMIALLIGSVPCSASETARSFTDSAGRTVPVPQTVQKVAPSGPLAQIFLYTLCPDKLAGIAADFSEEARLYINERYWGLPKFGQFYGKNANLNMEALIAAGPEVVVDVGEAKKTIRKDMDGLQRQLNMPVAFVRATLDTLPEAYALLGTLTGDTERAETLGAYCRKRLDHAASVRKELKDAERVRVYWASGKTGLNTNARGSFHAEVLEKVGAVNVADVEPNSRGSGSTVSMEQVLSWNPEVVLADSDALYEMITTDAIWSEVQAVKKGRVYKIPSAPYSFVSNPPSVNRLMGIQWLGRLLHPDRYTSDPAREIKDFYKLFYSIDLNDEQYNTLMRHAQ